MFRVFKATFMFIMLLNFIQPCEGGVADIQTEREILRVVFFC